MWSVRFGLLQPLRDALKLHDQGAHIPTAPNRVVSWMAPMLTLFCYGRLGGDSVSEGWVISNQCRCAVSVWAILRGVSAIIMAGWASESKYLLGACGSDRTDGVLRVSIGFVIITVLLAVGSLKRLISCWQKKRLVLHSLLADVSFVFVHFALARPSRAVRNLARRPKRTRDRLQRRVFGDGFALFFLV